MFVSFGVIDCAIAGCGHITSNKAGHDPFSHNWEKGLGDEGKFYIRVRGLLIFKYELMLTGMDEHQTEACVCFLWPSLGLSPPPQRVVSLDGGNSPPSNDSLCSLLSVKQNSQTWLN